MVFGDFDSALFQIDDEHRYRAVFPSRVDDSFIDNRAMRIRTRHNVDNGVRRKSNHGSGAIDQVDAYRRPRKSESLSYKHTFPFTFLEEKVTVCAFAPSNSASL